MSMKEKDVEPVPQRNQELMEKLDSLYETAEESVRPPSFNFDGGLSALARIIFLAPKERKAYTMRGEIYLSIGDLSSSLSNFRRSLSLDPTDALLQKRMAAVLDVQGNQKLMDGEYEVAASIFTKAIGFDGLCWQYFMHRALCKINMKRFRLALRDIDHVLILHKFSPDTYILRAKLRWYLGNIPEGNADFRRAHALDSRHPEVIVFEELLWKNADVAYREASSAIMTKNYSYALKKLKSAVELNPEDVKMLILKASVHRSLHEYGNALNDLDKASNVFHVQRENVFNESRQNNSSTASLLSSSSSSASSSSSSSSSSSAGATFAEHAEISRQRNLTLNDMAVERYKQGDYRSAITLFNQVIETEKKSDVSAAAAREGQSFVNVNFFSNRGDCHRELGMLQQALADYHVAYDLDSKNWETTTRLSIIHDRFGLELFNCGQYSEANVEFKTAIEYNCRIVLFRIHCAKCCLKINKLEDAYRQYEEILRLEPNNIIARRALSNFGGSIKAITDAEENKRSAARHNTILPSLSRSRSALKHSSSSGYLIPPKVPKILINGRKEEQKKIRRVNNIFNGECSLKDPNLQLLKGSKKNPYAKDTTV